MPGVDLPWGAFGENLTTEGLTEEARIGDRFRIGTAEFVVTQPRLPCFKLGIRLGRTDVLKRMLKTGRTGLYFSMAVEGEVGAGDEIEHVGVGEDLTVAQVASLYSGNRDEGLPRRAGRVDPPDRVVARSLPEATQVVVLPDFGHEKRDVHAEPGDTGTSIA